MSDPIEREESPTKGLVLVATLALFTGVAGTAAALTLTSLDVDRIGLWKASTNAPDIRMEGHDANVKAKDQVDVQVSLSNTDSAEAHEGNVTVQLLDSSGAILVEETKATGSIKADGKHKLDYTFDKSNLAADWAETFAVVDQSP